MVIKFHSYAVELFKIKERVDKATDEWKDTREIEGLVDLDEELEKNINGKLLMMTSSAVGDHYVVTIVYDDEERR